MTEKKEELIKSKNRVTSHGEVFTSEREVNAMLDLVKEETERVESRFLEPACGHGNFLIKILERKMNIVEYLYRNNQDEYELYSFIATSSIYGVDLQKDNISEARERLLGYLTSRYLGLFKLTVNGQFLGIIEYILSKNLIVGDALSMRCNSGKPILFPEWNLTEQKKIIRRDFSFAELLEHQEMKEMPLFAALSEEQFQPTPVKEYSEKDYLNVFEHG